MAISCDRSICSCFLSLTSHLSFAESVTCRVLSSYRRSFHLSHLARPKNQNQKHNQTENNHGQINTMGLRHRLHLSKMALYRSMWAPVRFIISIDSSLCAVCIGFHNDFTLPPLAITLRTPLCPFQCTRTCQSLHGHNDRSGCSADGSEADTC